jgi:hypothetical protein
MIVSLQLTTSKMKDGAMPSKIWWGPALSKGHPSLPYLSSSPSSHSTTLALDARHIPQCSLAQSPSEPNSHLSLEPKPRASANPTTSSGNSSRKNDHSFSNGANSKTNSPPPKNGFSRGLYRRMRGIRGVCRIE